MDNVTASDIIKFLAKEFEKDASYGSLNSIRSAISLIVGSEIGQSAIIGRFLKGVAKLRPSEPKYDSTWDPKIVLDYFKDVPNENLPLDGLSRKALTLLALVLGQRIQTLSLIDIRNIVINKEVMEIKLPDRVKTSRPGKKQPILVLPIYKENLNNRPMYTLQCYLEKTKPLRKDITTLFISPSRVFFKKKPFKRVTSQTLSRWLKDTLHDCGLDTNIFSAYSTRHASTSAAKRRGVNIDIIRSSAGWSEKSDTFAKFYNRPVVQNRSLYGQAILKG